MGDVVRFPVEKIDRYFDPAVYRETSAVVLILPVVRIDRDPDMERAVRERMPELLRRGRRRLPPAEGLLSPPAEERVRGAFNALDEAFRFAPAADPGPAGFVDYAALGWPWPTDTGDETD